MLRRGVTGIDDEIDRVVQAFWSSRDKPYSDKDHLFIACEDNEVLWLILNNLKLNGNYMYLLLQQSVTLHFVFIGFV
jgi:hypothetical protein